MTIENGGPAFPKAGLDPWNKAVSVNTGMTLLDYFAAEVLPAVYAEYMAGWRNGEHNGCDGWRYGLATDAYDIASAMLEVRKKYV